jgi:hypothetical protein
MEAATKKQLKRPQSASMLLDRETVDRFKIAAGDRALTHYMRDLSYSITGIVPSPNISIMSKLEQLLDEHNVLMDYIRHSSRVNISNIEYRTDSGEELPIDDVFLDSLNELNSGKPGPEVIPDSFFEPDVSTPVSEAAILRVEREKEAIAAYYDAVTIKQIKPIPEIIPDELLGDSDDAFEKRFRIHLQHKKKIIEIGQALLKEKKEKALKYPRRTHRK